MWKPHGVVVQLVRIPACHAGGRGFESRPLRQQNQWVAAVMLQPVVLCDFPVTRERIGKQPHESDRVIMACDQSCLDPTPST